MYRPSQVMKVCHTKVFHIIFLQIAPDSSNDICMGKDVKILVFDVKVNHTNMKIFKAFISRVLHSRKNSAKPAALD